MFPNEYSVIVCGFNVFSYIFFFYVGSYLLSFVFGWGFSGCAIASTIARAIMLVAIVSSICKTEDIRR